MEVCVESTSKKRPWHFYPHLFPVSVYHVIASFTLLLWRHTVTHTQNLHHLDISYPCAYLHLHLHLHTHTHTYIRTHAYISISYSHTHSTPPSRGTFLIKVVRSVQSPSQSQNNPCLRFHFIYRSQPFAFEPSFPLTSPLNLFR